MSAAPETHSSAWHGIRSTGIGASEAAVIAGLSPWGSAWALWAEKRGLIPHDATEATEAMDMGREIEPFLAAAFTRRTGLFVAGEQMMLRHRTEKWARATVDGLVFEGPSGTGDACDVGLALGGFEAKYDNGSPWDEVPVHYQCQAQWQAFVAGWERVWFGVLHGWGRYRIYEVERDDEAIAALVEVCSKFWHENVLGGVAPPLGGGNRKATAEALGRAFGEGGGGEVEIEGYAEHVASLRYLKRERKALTEQITDLENVLKAELGEAEVGLIDGRPAVTWKRTTSRRLDVKRHRAESPGCHKEFETESSSRRLLVKGEPDA